MTKSNNLKDVVPFRATHPGFVIEEELDYMGIRRKDFAEKIGMRPTHLSELLKGKRSLSADVALKIEQHTELKAEMLMALQAKYEVDVKRIAQQDEVGVNDTTQQDIDMNVVSIPLSSETYNRIQAVAQKQGTTITALIRSVIDKAVVLL